MLYIHIFWVHSQTVLLTYIAIAINFLQCLTCIIGYSIVCVPLPGQSWETADATPKCMETGDLIGVILASISIFNDFFILIIPIPTIWALQMTTRKKIGISVIFFTGLL